MIRAAEGSHSRLSWNLSGQAARPIAPPGCRPRTAPSAGRAGRVLIPREARSARWLRYCWATWRAPWPSARVLSRAGLDPVGQAVVARRSGLEGVARTLRSAPARAFGVLGVAPSCADTTVRRLTLGRDRERATTQAAPQCEYPESPRGERCSADACACPLRPWIAAGWLRSPP
jgi:hypothetical protein